MNRVGERGRGESVWLGFFLYDALQRFARGRARTRRRRPSPPTATTQPQRLRANLEAHAWDGAWYRRAWFDDGTPLGSTASDECRIDSIAQSWSVLSGAADPARARQAMASLDRYLVRRDAGLIQLLDPPFDQTAKDPGYIRGYVPGVRENGGQYTHAAIWAAMAFAQQRRRGAGLGAAAHDQSRPPRTRRRGRRALQGRTLRASPPTSMRVAPHVGRGGWTWYTGSAGWMYRLLIESLLGLQRARRTACRCAVPARRLAGGRAAIPLRRYGVPHPRASGYGYERAAQRSSSMASSRSMA